MQNPDDSITTSLEIAPLHIAMVKIRAPQDISDETLNGVARTLSQLGKLGLTSTVVVDCDEYSKGKEEEYGDNWKELASQQVDRIVAAIDAHGRPGSRRVDNIIGVSEEKIDGIVSAAAVRGSTHIVYRKLLLTPLRRGVIPVIPSIGYTDQTHQAVPVKCDDAVLALTREFCGFQRPPNPDDDPKDIAERMKTLRSQVSLDRLIVIDPLGGIPASNSPNGYHVFLNMEQEYATVKKDLLNAQASYSVPRHMSHDDEIAQISDVAMSNPFSKFVEAEFSSKSSAEESHSLPNAANDLSQNKHHLQNLELVRRVLSLLPPSSSALLTTPEEAANSGNQPDASFHGTGVGTRRQQNPLIHNLLTDKPVFSSSLPAGRLGQSPALEGRKPVTVLGRRSPTTFAKRGMSVTIFPDPLLHSWKPPIRGKSQISLTDPRIDLSRLVHLINDSFDRKLDVQSYLKRVNDRIAGVIIAGEYEGGALLTWEMPPGVVDDGSEESRSRMVPYLDKFAVLKQSQGSGGVADILFKVMVRDCFPDGVCWRSRRDNPVNKWYFERSRGTWKMPHTNWTMFWTTSDLDMKQQTFSDYEGICRSIEPTWADRKVVVD